MTTTDWKQLGVMRIPGTRGEPGREPLGIEIAFPLRPDDVLGKHCIVITSEIADDVRAEWGSAEAEKNLSEQMQIAWDRTVQENYPGKGHVKQAIMESWRDLQRCSMMIQFKCCAGNESRGHRARPANAPKYDGPMMETAPL